MGLMDKLENRSLVAPDLFLIKGRSGTTKARARPMDSPSYLGGGALRLNSGLWLSRMNRTIQRKNGERRPTMVEVPGIEPGSLGPSIKASTCLDCLLTLHLTVSDKQDTD